MSPGPSDLIAECDFLVCSDKEHWQLIDELLAGGL